MGGDSSERKEGKEVRGRMENYENAEDKNGGEDVVRPAELRAAWDCGRES